MLAQDIRMLVEESLNFILKVRYQTQRVIYYLLLSRVTPRGDGAMQDLSKKSNIEPKVTFGLKERAFCN